MSFIHYGKWKRSTQIVSGSGIFTATGSNSGVEGILMGTNPEGTIVLTDGGSITIDNLTNTVVHEFSVNTVEVTGGDHVYLLYDRRA